MPYTSLPDIQDMCALIKHMQSQTFFHLIICQCNTDAYDGHYRVMHYAAFNSLGVECL